MAKENWRNNPEIMAAKNYAERFGRKAVIILSFDFTTFGVTSYGEDKKLCDAAGKLALRIYNEVATGELVLET